MSSGNGTTYGYYIEARETHWLASKITTIGEVVIGPDWTRIPLQRVEDGVPTGMWCRVADAVSDLVSYASAFAQIARAQAGLSPFSGIEFRLVEAKLTYSWAIEETAKGEPINFRDRESKEFFAGRGVRKAGAVVDSEALQ